ncbi:MAG TPA: extracellular solute-binding protein [Candidatus Binatia bacterium]|nr:extracellular solute-binding protein [Candidatus Binatia bacterium]
MNRQRDRRIWPTRCVPSWVFILLVSLLFNVPVVGAADRLVLVSVHWEGIKHEFERAFKAHYLRETGRTVELEWLDVGGTSETIRFIRSEFSNKPAGIGIDIFFGGGLDPYVALKKDNLLEPYVLPQQLLEKIPPSLGGVPLFDPGHAWYGATLSGFGIVYNKVVLQLTKMPVISTWEGLASPKAFGWVGSSDPRKSGSVHVAYEIILQAYGWEKGWQIITGLGANVRNYTNSASQVPKDVAIGEVAYGLAIDFYAWAQVNEAGADKIGFIMPDNLTMISPDSIGILKGAPNRAVAEAFVRFAMSETAQKLWLWSKGTVDGPQRYQLNRFSVLPSLYELSPQNSAVKLNPFSWRSGFVFDEKLGSARWSIVNDLIGTMVIEPKDLLSQAWRAASVDGLTEQEWQRLAAMPVSADEALDFAKNKWKDPAFRNQKLIEWSQFARGKYQTGVKPSFIRSDWLSLIAMVIIALGLIVYSRSSKG